MDRTRAAQRAERLALAVIRAEATIDDVRDDMRQASREREVADTAQALRDYRSGAPIWAWPRCAPWTDF